MSDSDREPAIRSRCNDVRALVEDWLDNLPDGDARSRIGAHLGECPECAEFFSRRRQLTDDLRTLGRAADALAEAGPSRVRPRLVKWRSWSIAAATILFFLTAGLYLSEFRHASESIPGDERPEPSPSGVQPAVEKASPGLSAGSAGGRDFVMTCPEGRMLVPMASTNPRIHIVWLYDQTNSTETSAEGGDARPPASPG